MDAFIEHIISCFENTMLDLEALDNFFESTRNMLNKKRNSIDEEYRTALAIVELLDGVYEKESNEREAEIEQICEYEIFDGVKLKDIMDIDLFGDELNIQYSLKGRFANRKYSPTDARRELMMLSNQRNIFIRSILSNLIIIFEKYLSMQYRDLVLNEPKRYFENKTINISELLEKDIQIIIQQEIESEVENNMFDSIKALDKINNKSEINLDRYIEIRKEFEEVYYRRNIFVHCDGVVNETYLSKVDEKYRKDVEIDDCLVCDDIYLENAIFIVKKVIASLHCEMLRHFNATQDDYGTVANYAFEALQKSQYSLAEYIYGLLRREKSFDYNYKIIYEINYINALKQQGKDVRSLLDKLDVSIAIDRYKIAKECLLDNYESVYDMLNISYPDSFCAIMIREWPVFINFRETDLYDKFVNEHKTDFDKFIFEENL